MGAGAPEHHLAQFNVALPLEPLDSERMSGFTAMLDLVNARADSAPGFVWRLQDDEGNATGFESARDDRLIVNLSVWETIEALRAFAYTDAEHAGVLRRRREWFEPLRTWLVLWWVPAGHIPTLAEAEQRLVLLERDGPSPRAFTFRRAFAAPAQPAS